MSILEVKGLKKTYTTRFGGNQVQALKNVSFSVEEGEYVAIMGESGSVSRSIGRIDRVVFLKRSMFSVSSLQIAITFPRTLK